MAVASMSAASMAAANMHGQLLHSLILHTGCTGRFAQELVLFVSVVSQILCLHSFVFVSVCLRVCVCLSFGLSES